MRLSGWIMMILSIGTVLGLAIFCFYRILKAPRTEEHIHAPLDIDTHETDEPCQPAPPPGPPDAGGQR